MGAIRARMIAAFAALVLGWITVYFGSEVAAQFEGWVLSFATVLLDGSILLYYVIIHPLIQKRWNPTGTYTTHSAYQLEHVAHESGLATKSGKV
jgi:hypothetical protein